MNEETVGWPKAPSWPCMVIVVSVLLQNIFFTGSLKPF